MRVSNLCRTASTVAVFLISMSFAQSTINQSARLLHQYDPITWVENLAVRPNGEILPIITLGTSAILNKVNPVSDEVSQVHNFSPAGNSIQSIATVTPDVFAVNVFTCNISALDCTLGSASTWLVDFRRHGTHPKVSQVVSWPQAKFLNGMAALNDHILLIADSFLGGIWSLDINSGVQKLLFTETTMSGTAESPTGVNGIRIWDRTLYFTNTAKDTLNSISIDPKTGKKTGDAVVIASGLLNPDDLEIDGRNDVAYVANGLGNQILRIDLKDGRSEVVTSLPGPTSLRWVIGCEGSKLYVSTCGGILQYAIGNITLGGALYEIDV
ncbi:hypothetical protein H2198_005341 [Neophaeococcomyces mojaviensis]|uniref:Uncharacterized protein n=1 Tax=Neophaeococcomyces mojaviensis TaxID=3383035 RepID=A0ACC3A6H3_9EURO|nr:hypothetical protein H2198_005341 [Knufia sp. JES_112]